MPDTFNDPSPRQALAARQQALVRALAGGDVPAGFDADRVGRAAQSLQSKRRRGVAKAWPSLSKGLGDAFRPLFDAFAAATPLPPGGAPADDGYAFAEHLSRGGGLPDEARIDLLVARCARGRFVQLMSLRPVMGFAVAVRTPGGRIWWTVLRPGNWFRRRRK